VWDNFDGFAHGLIDRWLWMHFVQKAAIKREQSHACMNYAEREQARNAVSNFLTAPCRAEIFQIGFKLFKSSF
jgi:hypothetical protein